MPVVLFVESLSYPTLILSLCFKCIGIDVVCFNIKNRLFDTKKQFLNKFGIKLVSFSKLPKITPSVISGDAQDKITKCVENLFKGDHMFEFFQDLFPGIDDLNRKLRIFARQYASYGFRDQMSMIHWLENSEYRDSLIISLVSYRGNIKYLWDNSDLNVFNIYLPGWEVAKRIPLFFKSLVIKILAKILTRKSHNKVLSRPESVKEDKLKKDAKVVYFPHQSIFSSSYVKDHFYANDPESPFHVANIQHIEYDKRSNISADRDMTREYMGCDTIQYESLHEVSYVDLLPSMVSLLIYFVRNIHRIVFLDRFKLSAIITFVTLYITYKKYYIATSCLKKTKIALVGYDILFPKGLSLALETRGIRTIAIQERFSMPFFNEFSYILDTQLTVSAYVDKVIKEKHNHFFVKYLVPVGQSRSDYFFVQKKKAIEEFAHRVIVFDFHVEPNPLSQRKSLYLNWDNDRSFRQDILSLAELYPAIEFVFRGKNDDWLYNKYFSDIVEKVNRNHNIQVDSDYNTWGHSYNIASNADLIIAKPTSIAEECISNGYQVLVADYGLNYSEHVSAYYPHSDKGNYCRSFTELQDKFKLFMSRGYVVEHENMKFMTEELFGGLTDGNVRNRIQKHLHSILDQ